MARSDGPALRRVSWHLGALVLTGTLLWLCRATLWALPLLVAHGYVLAFIFCAFHETAHRTAFRTRWLNAAVGTLAGFLTFWPYRNYRVYHWEHHRHTQDPSLDPELFFPKPASWPVYLLVLTGIPNAIRRIGDMLRLAAGRADRPWMAPAGASAPHRRGAGLSRRLRGGGRGLGAGRLADCAARLDRAVDGRPGVPAALSPGRAHRLRGHPRLPREHAHHAHAGARASLRVEHAVPLRAPRLPGGALPRAAPAARAGTRAASSISSPATWRPP